MTNEVITPYVVTKCDSGATYQANVVSVAEVTKKTSTGKEKIYHRAATTKMDLPKGYIVKFPKGHSIHVTTKEELDRLGFVDSSIPAPVDEFGDTEEDIKALTKKKG